MAIEVSFSDNAGWVLDKAKVFLRSKPVHNNVILALLHARVEHFIPGRYWVAADRNTVVGVAFQSPLNLRAIVTPMESSIVRSVVDAISDAKVKLPGVGGDATTAAHFAGQWAERQKSAVIPFMGQRIYEVNKVEEPTGVKGHLRKAVPSDRERLIDWVRHFWADTNAVQESNAESLVDRRVSAGQVWLWDSAGPVSMAGLTSPVEGVVRVQLVYTPPENRGNGYASACVASLSKQVRDEGHRCILYTDLGNPVSNSIYRRIGYFVVAEGIHYRFE
ncbi:MAG: GNAT family N-acetyltransferase [Candidatus Poribacteria bacterium]|nr:GNAT family N-acetyltransferase [Candidatus Poribacteria bacterium]